MLKTKKKSKKSVFFQKKFAFASIKQLAKIGNITLKKINSTRQTLCLSVLFQSSVWRVSNSIFF